jgi:hypothetical protein
MPAPRSAVAETRVRVAMIWSTAKGSTSGILPKSRDELKFPCSTVQPYRLLPRKSRSSDV